MKPVIVLKFGGSLLTDEASYARVAAEIARVAGQHCESAIVAVVSARSGETDRLIEEARMRPALSASQVVEHIASGEVMSSYILGLALSQRRLRSNLIGSSAIGIRTRGDAHEAVPTTLLRESLDEALSASSIVVHPGFLAYDEQTGAPTLLGRSGSDFTAIFLADALGAARCRLYKATPGCVDPTTAAQLTWEQVLASDASRALIQPAAARYAAARGMVVEFGPLGAAADAYPRIAPRR